MPDNLPFYFSENFWYSLVVGCTFAVSVALIIKIVAVKRQLRADIARLVAILKGVEEAALQLRPKRQDYMGLAEFKWIDQSILQGKDILKDVSVPRAVPDHNALDDIQEAIAELTKSLKWLDNPANELTTEQEEAIIKSGCMAK